MQELVAFNLINIGENAGKISDELKLSNSTIPWRQISALRNIIVHDYGNTDVEQVYSTIHNDLIPLKEAFLKIKRELK